MNTKNLQDLRHNRNGWLRDLVQLLEAADFPGQAVFFYDCGWQELIRKALLGDDAAAAVTVAKQAAEEARYVEEAAASPRVVVVTTLDLLPLIENLRYSEIPLPKLANFLGTSFNFSPYDFPKLIESFVRLRNLGGCPVLRVDEDVLFNAEMYPATNLTAPLAMAQPIRAMVTEYRQRSSWPDQRAFLISGRYLNSPGTSNKWLGAFATRPFPALAVDSSGEAIFDDRTLSTYYGVDDTISHVERSPAGVPAGISRFGAPPLNAPISGALLTFNAPLVVDAPPFCNFRNNVWIDDFLKFAMHREMHRMSNDAVSPGFSNSPSIPTIEVLKVRPPITNVRDYTLDIYLPALVRGCVVDAWIQPLAMTKLDFSLPAVPGPLIRYLQTARKQGRFRPELFGSCREELWELAIERLNEIQCQWSQLPLIDGQPSLANEWIDRGKLAREVELRTRIDDPLKRMDQCGLAELISLETLIEDTLEYIEWAVAWPVVANAVRALPQGSFKFDLS